jgi:hypothetical protein
MNIYRNFANAVHKAGMDTDEYVYILRTTVKRLGNKNVTNDIFFNSPFYGHIITDILLSAFVLHEPAGALLMSY